MNDQKMIENGDYSLEKIYNALDKFFKPKE